MSQEAQALKASIESYYAEFGKDISRLVADQLVDKGGFEVLLPQLGVPDPGDVGARYESLLTYLRTKGSGAFLAKVSGLGKDFRIEMSDTRSLQSENDRRLREIAVREAQRRKQIKAESEKVPSTLVPKVEAEPEPAPPPAPVVPQRAHASVKVQLEALPPEPAAPAGAPPPQKWPVRFTGPLVSGPPPRPENLDPRALAYDPNKPYNPSGEWPAVERRSGIERRSGQDRRGNVELIFKNRRYGRDRRSKIERRRGWSHKGFRTPDGGYVQ